MPQQPDAGFAPSVDIDDTKKYVVKLVGITEQASQYRDRRKDAMTEVHRFLVYDLETGVAVVDNVTGEIYEQWMFTGDATYDNPTSGKIAPAREIANALCGKRLSDADVKDMLNAGWEQSLVGKFAIADLEWYATADGTQRLKILRLKPYRGRGQTPEPAMAAPAPAPAAPRMRPDDGSNDPTVLPF